MMNDVGYACMRDPEIMGMVNVACADAKTTLHVMMKCAYPVMFCMVNAACAGVFREVPWCAALFGGI